MRTRTYLTTPPGRVPSDADPVGVVERWVPGPGAPTEPRVPGRHRGRLMIGVVVLVGVLMALGGAWLLGQVQPQNPSLSGSAGQR